MELFVAGFNAWNQLHFDSGQEGSQNVPEPDDVRTFRLVLTDESIDSVEASLSYTRVRSTPSGLRSAGVAPQGHEALRTTGYLDESRYLTAEASNGVVVVYKKATRCVTQYPSIQSLLAHHQIASQLIDNTQPLPSSSLNWSHTFPDPIVQLIAYETGFAALSSKGSVYTWGDERYSACLGREVTDDSPADHPHPIPELESLPTGRITKIAAGSGTGTIIAALTKGNDLYAWGQPPRAELCRSLPFSPICSQSLLASYSTLEISPTIFQIFSTKLQRPSAILQASLSASTVTSSDMKGGGKKSGKKSSGKKSGGEKTSQSSNAGPVLSSLNLTSDPTPLDVADWKDITDIAVGDRYLLALTTKGELFAIGDNTNGQLGLPGVKRATDVWTKVEIDDDRIKSGGAVITGVVAGPRNSFVIIRTM